MTSTVIFRPVTGYHDKFKNALWKLQLRENYFCYELLLLQKRTRWQTAGCVIATAAVDSFAERTNGRFEKYKRSVRAKGAKASNYLTVLCVFLSYPRKVTVVAALTFIHLTINYSENDEIRLFIMPHWCLAVAASTGCALYIYVLLLRCC